MATDTTFLPAHRPRKVSDYEKGARVLAVLVYLSFGFFARLAILVLWIFMDLLGDAYDSWILPVIGFVLVPWTTLTFSFMWTIGSDKVSGWEWIAVALAMLVDYVFWVWSWSTFK
jgi:hypothetical protein